MITFFGQKPADHLLPTSLFQQTSYWGRVKSRLGWAPKAYDLGTNGGVGDVLVVVRNVARDSQIAYVPYGPELLPDDDRQGVFLEELSEELRERLPKTCLLIRWDLPWESPYAREPELYDEAGVWKGAPEPRVREMRMNFGTNRGRLRKALGNVLPTDTVLVSLSGSEEELLSRMKPKTRYNVRLALRNGVEVREGGPGDLPAWMELYTETAARNGFFRHGEEYFRAVFPDGSGGSGLEKIKFLVAEREGVPLAALFLAVSSTRATYLYGASSSGGRSLMAPYALQWAAIRTARAEGCDDYDLFGVSPRPDPNHPMYGLYRFKSGFGGSLFHRQGCWDYPLDSEGYAEFRARELGDAGFYCA